MPSAESRSVGGFERHPDLPPTAARALPFVLGGDGQTLEAHGATRTLSASMAGTLLGDASEALADASDDGILVGALPFDRQAAAWLVIPEWTVYQSTEPCRARNLPLSEPGGSWRLVESPSRADYVANVRQAVAHIARAPSGTEFGLDKIVLARTLQVASDRPIDPARVLARLLCDRKASAFCVPLPAGPSGLARTLVGASPELLIEKRGRQVISLPMAGSAERSADLESDRTAADTLAQSGKDQREHRMVVEWVLDTLAPHCRQLHAPDVPVLAATATMWHLATPIEGELRREVSSLELAAALHPTPAVCGTPAAGAGALLPDLEPFDRGFFGGALGWCDRAGDGRWLVTIRCAEISGHDAILYAGAGIVQGSDPESEAAETSAKFRTLLRALGIDERGQPLPAVAG